MKKITLISLLFFTQLSIAATPITNTQSTLAPMLSKVMPAVVNISVRGQLPPATMDSEENNNHQTNSQNNNGYTNHQPKKFAGLGSGVIMDAKHGLIVTNAHVLKDAKVILVSLKDGRRFQANLLGVDEKSDIAVIKINAKHLSAIKLGDSSKLRVGDFVAAVGNPFGLNQTVTSGVISGLGRTQLGIDGYENFIQTDASINPGNSGGALVNSKGELIGINTAILSPYNLGGNIGIGFAIPVNMCKEVVQQIVTYGKVEHSVVGLMLQNISPALANAMQLRSTRGALVSSVVPNSPGDHAKLKSRDIIIGIDGRKVRDAFQVSTAVGLMRPSSKIKLEVLRQGKSFHTTIKTISITEMQKIVKENSNDLLAGVAIHNFDQIFDDDHIIGVQVLRVGAFSVAYSSGLRPGDVILEAANKEIHDIAELQKLVSKHKDNLLLKIKRDAYGPDLFIVLER
ncbi:MAG: Do family serine endopeptidase [Gammaproteobacteria bacterium]|nr:Do family serine endopeptidase [Gammaproteobacteria bacterium]